MFGLSNNAHGGEDLGRSEFAGKSSRFRACISLRCSDTQMKRLSSHMDMF